MKKIIPFLMLLILSTTSFAQQTNPTLALSKQNYLQKSKNQKTAAWIMLGGGFVMSATGFTISLVNGIGDAFAGLITGDNSSSGNSIDMGSVFFTAGAAAMFGSIPLFIASGRNKRKAMSLSFNIQQVMQPEQYGFANHNIPSLSLRMTLGKPK